LVSLIPLQGKKGIDHRKASPISAISNLLEQDESKVSQSVLSFYKDIQAGDAILVNSVSAKYAIFLKQVMPFLCGDVKHKVEADSLLTAVSNQEGNLSSAIGSDFRLMDKSDSIGIPTKVLALVAILNLACDSKANNFDDNVESVINRAGSQLGSSMIRNGDTAYSSNEFLKLAANAFGTTIEEFEARMERDLDQIKSQGFMLVDDGVIRNLDELYNQNNESFKSILEVEPKLAFIPSINSVYIEYQLLGASGSGVVSVSGFSAMGKMYDTPMGKLSILEEDLIAANGFTLVEPEYLNTQIGKHLASLVVLKGRDSGAFKTEIYWINSISNREFTVEVNINLNDESNSTLKNNLFDFLTKSYGEHYIVQLTR
jgi:hypothetical protein